MTSPDPAVPEAPQDVTYTYWPVNYTTGDPVKISASSLPLSGVRFSSLARGVGELRASLQLADQQVRAIDPWSLIVPRRTGIVVVRTVTDPRTGGQAHQAVAHFVVLQAKPVPATGRMEIMAQTVEGMWARRRISGPPPVGFRDAEGNIRPGIRWENVDQAQIARDLLDPDVWCQFGNVQGTWITVEAPQDDMGVIRTHEYRRGQNTNLLEAHQDRSTVLNGYEWFTTVRTLDGPNARDATSYRLQMVWGYPRLPGVYGVDNVPRFSYYVDGRGNVVHIEPEYTGVNVANVVWGVGAGYDVDALRRQAWNSADWNEGALMFEDAYSNPDVSIGLTLEAQVIARMAQLYASEQYLRSLSVRGDLAPYFGTYPIGNDVLVSTDDWTWPDNPDGTRGVTYVSRVMGWVVTPPEGEQAEHVELVLAGQEVV